MRGAPELVAVVVEERGLPGPNRASLGALDHYLGFRLLDSSQITSNSCVSKVDSLESNAAVSYPMLVAPTL